MSRSVFYGGQIKDAIIVDSHVSPTANISLSKIANGTSIILATGTVPFVANQSMGSHKVTNLADGVDPNDAVNKGQLDNAITGLSWKGPVSTVGLVGNASVLTLNGLAPIRRDAYVVTDSGVLSAGSLSVSAGDLVEFDGAAWVLLVGNALGVVPAGTRAGLSTATNLIPPYTNGVDDGKIVAFPGASNTGVSTAEAEDGIAVLVTNDNSVDNSIGFTLEGNVGSGSWVQFTGAGQINAGSGMWKTGNTLNVGEGNGIQVNADTVEIKIDSVVANPFLETTAAGLRMVGLSSGSLIVGNSSGRPTAVALSGDATLSNLGVITLSSNVLKESDYVNSETPAGAINGVNTAFVLANVPVFGVQVFYNGQLLEIGPGNDYLLSGANLTMLWAPATNAKLVVSYWK